MKRRIKGAGLWRMLGGLLILGCLLCWAPHSLTVRADVIWEPEDSFYEKHAGECTYVNRWFTANGPDGVVILYKSPEIPEVVDTWENGYRAFINFTYEDEDGVLWGINEGKKTGWMPMEYMEVVYDNISFKEEYGDQIRSEKGALEDKYAGEEIYFWRYPGELEPLSVMVGEHTPEYSGVFIDEYGNSWGSVGYYYGYKGFWVCLENPKGDYGELYPEGGPERGKSAEQLAEDAKQENPLGTQDGKGDGAGAERIVPKSNYGAVIVAAVMVLAVALGTIILLVVMLSRSGKRK